MRPRCFFSSASDDKDRFALKFAERLRTNGVDVWLDTWEINAGDNRPPQPIEKPSRHRAICHASLPPRLFDKSMRFSFSCLSRYQKATADKNSQTEEAHTE